VGARFFAYFQTGPGAHPSSCTMGTGSFPGVKRPGRCANHPTPSNAEVKKELSYTSTPLQGFETCYRANFTYFILVFLQCYCGGMFCTTHCIIISQPNKNLKILILYSPIMTSLVAWWSELLATNNEVPGSIPGSAVGISPCRGRSRQRPSSG
jgi:hypothetical protein